MKILLCSDTAPPHICGLARKIGLLENYLKEQGHEVRILGPFNFSHVNIYSFPVSFPNLISLSRIISNYNPDLVCLFSEGPVGFSCRTCCRWQGRPFATMYCTRLPEYFGIYMSRYYLQRPTEYLTKKYIKWFHKKSQVVITPSQSMKDIMDQYYSTTDSKIKAIPNGCDTQAFSAQGEPYQPLIDSAKPRPYWLFVGRVSKEKNIPAFLDLKLPGTKIVVGDGAELDNYQQEYPKNTIFLGRQTGETLSSIYRTCDIFVFPSRTDTFGQVMVEAMASGLPVAAYPVPGPIDVVQHKKTGYLSEDLNEACLKTYLILKQHPGIKQRCIKHAKTFSWDQSLSDIFQTLQNST